MATRRGNDSESGSKALTHNPFASLSEKRERLAGVEPAARNPATQSRPISAPRPVDAPPWRLAAVRVRQESLGRSGKVVTRISGLPLANLSAIAARMRKALGCAATLDAETLLLQGSLAERASAWLNGAGDLREIREEAPAREHAAPAPAAAESASFRGTGAAAASGSGTRRADIHRGSSVAIVLKADQGTGALTEGVVRDILTSSPTHPRGIKVRLETGEVGRVKYIRC